MQRVRSGAKAPHKRGEAGRSGKRLWYFSGILPALLTLAGLLLASAAILNRGILPGELMPYLTLSAVFIASAVSGFCCAGARRGGAVTAGLCSAGIIMLLLALAALTVPGGKAAGADFLRLCIAALCGSLFGGVLKASPIRVNSGKRRRVRRK